MGPNRGEESASLSHEAFASHAKEDTLRHPIPANGLNRLARYRIQEKVETLELRTQEFAHRYASCKGSEVPRSRELHEFANSQSKPRVGRSKMEGDKKRNRSVHLEHPVIITLNRNRHTKNR